ncbi:MAG: L-threonylcarbamoyladenylate synthase [Dehalococcoidales bacterium]
MEEPAAGTQRQIEEAIRILKEGGIVAFPTDTVYGLAAAVTIPRAVERVYAAKQRPAGMALPLLVADDDGIAGLAATVPPTAQRLIEVFLPGPLTIVLAASGAVPEAVTAAGSTVAVRIPAHPIPIALIRGTGGPITGTSANVSGLPSPLTAAEVRSQLGDGVDLIIDSGEPCPGAVSTIVDVSGATPVVLREGAISLARLREVLGEIGTGEGD